MNVKVLFRVSAMTEMSTGLALLVAPVFVVGLLLGNGVGPIGIAVARLLGVGLISVGVAGWESSDPCPHLAQRAGLCTYNVGSAGLLALLGVFDGADGFLLWPAVGLHALLATMMLWSFVASPRDGTP